MMSNAATEYQGYPGDTRNLPEHLRKAWGYMLIDPRENPNYCPKQSRKTPVIPWHNGFKRCLSCGKEY